MPDHVPQIDGRDPSAIAFAYCYGYIQALIDALAPPADRSHNRLIS
jgi:mannonate dehydratase